MEFRKRLQLRHPLIVAPMAGGPSSVELVVASCKAGALGSIGAAYSDPASIADFVSKVRAQTDKPFAINLFIPNSIPDVGESQINEAIKATSAYREELGLTQPKLKPPYEEDLKLSLQKS